MRLNSGLKYVSVKEGEESKFDNIFLNHLSFARQCNDRLSANYNLKAIQRMVEYGYVFNEDPKDMVMMVGIEDFGNRAYRIESKLFVHPKYRSSFWRSPDDYETVKYQISKHKSDSQFLFKSREAKNPAALKVSARLDSFFQDWFIYPEKIELRYKDNWQWIMYKRSMGGDVKNHVQKLLYSH